jgi:hypothetical protein
MLGYDAFAIGNIIGHVLKVAILVALLLAAVRLSSISKSSLPAKRPCRRVVMLSATLAAMFLPIGWRLALLPWRPIPEPVFHDEFTHLLVADTLIHGRLANPPHALWRHLDTLYVLQRPNYASIYPVGQGAMLAAGGILTGNPWYGVVLATALMCGAMAWVLFELLPLWWAAAGILPIAFTYGLAWLDSYWGGAFCALGGAILFGALLRLRKSPSAAMTFVAALGWSIIWLIRPFESIFLFFFLWGSIAILAVRAGGARKRAGISRRQWITPVAMLAFVQGLAGALTLLHNRAVTGSFTELPYTLSRQVDGVPQNFAGQPPVAAPPFRFPEMREMYFWQLAQKQRTAFARARSMTRMVWEFFVTPWFTLPFFLALFAIQDRAVLAAWALLFCAAAASLLYPFFFPHYIAAYACVLAFLIVRGLMVLAGWSFRGRPVGRWFALFIFLGGLLNEPLAIASPNSMPNGPDSRLENSRAFIRDKLKNMGGAHVAFVRYGPQHQMFDEWVYNAADVDAAPVVWCRWMGLDEDREVMRYYPGRKFWIVDVDATRIATGVSRYLQR